jgi:hypothetical protein
MLYQSDEAISPSTKTKPLRNVPLLNRHRYHCGPGIGVVAGELEDDAPVAGGRSPDLIPVDSAYPCEVPIFQPFPTYGDTRPSGEEARSRHGKQTCGKEKLSKVARIERIDDASQCRARECNAQQDKGDSSDKQRAPCLDAAVGISHSKA